MTRAEEFLIFFLQLFVTVALGSSRRGAIQFRISEAEFSKVAGVLLSSPEKYITYEDECTIVDKISRYSVSFKNLKIEEGVPTAVNVTIPKDDNIRAVTTFTDMTISSTINRTSETNQNVKYLELFVRLREVRILAEGQIETLTGQGIGVTLAVPKCEVLSLQVDTENLNNSIRQELSSAELDSILKQMICETYQMQFSLGFDDGELDLQLDIFDAYTSTKAVNLQIKNSTIIVTQMLHFSTEKNDLPSFDTMKGVHETIAEFPPLRENNRPFEIWLNSDIFRDFWEFYKKGRGIGTVDIALHELFPILSYTNISTDYVPYLTQLYTTYPDAKANFKLKDADVTANITKGAFQMNFNLTGYMEVTLDCDPSRKYSAMDFMMFAYVPTQVAPIDNAVTFRFYGFGGNTTILNSTIGHVKSRHLNVLFYTLPQLQDYESWFKPINDKIKGVDLRKLLPNNLFMGDVSTELVQDHIVIGGRLMKEKPHVPPRDSTDWVGDISMAPDLIFPLYDKTAEDLQPLEEQNCDPPIPTPPIGEAHRIKQNTFLTILSLLTIYVFAMSV